MLEGCYRRPRPEVFPPISLDDYNDENGDDDLKDGDNGDGDLKDGDNGYFKGW